MLIPHLYWLYQHHFITLTYAEHVSSDYTEIRKTLNHVSFPLRFFANNIIDVAGLFILLWPFYNKNKIQLDVDSFKWQFLIFIGMGPLILSLGLCIISGDYFPPRWATPYFFTLGILSLAYLKPIITKKNLQCFAITLVLFSATLFIIRMSAFMFFARPGSDAFLPNKKIALSLSQLWQEQYHSKLPYLAGSNYLVATVTPYLSDES